MARPLSGTALRVRRGRRRDLPGVQALLAVPAGDRLERFFRRIVADLGTDVYVAEDAGGEIAGILCIVYARSLVRGGLSATLDGARVRDASDRAALDRLVAFAEERARRRGCRRIAAWVDAGDAALRDTLMARGWQAGTLLVTELARAS
jgi:GNAT superfamily N-acetyltransferase